jgi:uncharacterized protein YeaO (DUF488 family)
MSAARENIAVKRVYDAPAKSDGVRVLVDRLWPRGLTKEDAKIDFWLRDLAPSNELRKWVHSHPERWPEFHKRYFQELRGTPAAVDELLKLVRAKKPVTLLFASKNVERNNATVLKDLIASIGKSSRAEAVKSEPTQSSR